MRKEPFGIGDYVHVYNRGNKKLPIVKDDKDRQHFIQILFYFNTEQTPPNPFHDLKKLRLNLNWLIWPEHWKPRKPIVNILAFILMENHFHLILEEVVENGIAKFMQRLGTGMTMYYNKRHQETGALFQGSYKAKIIDNDVYLKYINIYIQIKNCFELYGGGFEKAMKEFDKAYVWATKFPYGSLSHYQNKMSSTILDKELFYKLFKSTKDHRNFSKECILDLEKRLGDLTIEET
ncbi:MAG: transposase [Patescibacteria group bacterium]